MIENNIKKRVDTQLMANMVIKLQTAEVYKRGFWVCSRRQFVQHQIHKCLNSVLRVAKPTMEIRKCCTSGAARTDVCRCRVDTVVCVASQFTLTDSSLLIYACFTVTAHKLALDCEHVFVVQ